MVYINISFIDSPG